MSFVFSGKLVVLWIMGKFEGLFSIYIIIKIILYSSFIDIFMFFGVFFWFLEIFLYVLKVICKILCMW